MGAFRARLLPLPLLLLLLIFDVILINSSFNPTIFLATMALRIKVALSSEMHLPPVDVDKCLQVANARLHTYTGCFVSIV